MFSKTDIEVESKDYTLANEPLIYIAPSKAELDQLINDLPPVKSEIFYVNPSCFHHGLYCEGPLSLSQGFDISTDSNLVTTGCIILEDYHLDLRSNGSVWLLCLKGQLNKRLIVKAKEKAYISYDPKALTLGVKLDEMSDETWRMCQQGWKKLR